MHTATNSTALTDVQLMKQRKKAYEDQLQKEVDLINGTVTANSNQLVNIHLGCTIRQIFEIPGLILPGGLLTLIVYPKKENSKACQHFVSKNIKDMGYSSTHYDPLGVMSYNPV